MLRLNIILYTILLLLWLIGCVLFLLIMKTARSELIPELQRTTGRITTDAFEVTEPDYPGTLPEYADKLQDLF